MSEIIRGENGIFITILYIINLTLIFLQDGQSTGEVKMIGLDNFDNIRGKVRFF